MHPATRGLIPALAGARGAGFGVRRRGNAPGMLWIILIILLVLIFGIGTILEAAFWILLIIAAVVVIGALLGGRALGGRA